MLSLIPLMTLFCVGYFACLHRLITAALEAPVGYEDEAGFHYGLQPAAVQVRR